MLARVLGLESGQADAAAAHVTGLRDTYVRVGPSEIGFADGIFGFAGRIFSERLNAGSDRPTAVDAGVVEGAFRAYLIGGQSVFFGSRVPQRALAKRVDGDIVVAYHALASSEIGSDFARTIARFLGQVRNSSASPENERNRLDALLRSAGMRSQVEALLATYDTFFFDRLIHEVQQGVQSARTALAQGNSDDALVQLKGLLPRIERSTDLRTCLRALLIGYEQQDEINARADDGEAWALMLRQGRSLLHDLNGIETAMGGFIRLVVRLGQRDVAELERTMRSYLLQYDLSTVGSIFRFVRTMLEPMAKHQGVDLRLGELSERFVAPGRRRALLRMINEYGSNALKYHARERARRTVYLDARERGGVVRPRVIDNGVGIGDIDAARRMDVRERPDLADGTGTGLAGNEMLAQMNGWTVALDSRPGLWTKAEIVISSDELGVSSDEALVEAISVYSDADGFSPEVIAEAVLSGAYGLDATVPFSPVVPTLL